MPARRDLLLVIFSNFVFSAVTRSTLLISNNNDILQLDNNGTSRVVGADLPIRAFDVHQGWRQLYWATDYNIYRTPLYDLKTTTLVAATGLVDSLAVDWVHNHVYWTDLTALRIESAHLDGKARRVVYTSTLPLGALVLDPEVGKCFWIEANPFGPKRIRSATLDGSQVKDIYITDDISEGSPLALDVLENNLLEQNIYLGYRSIYFYKTNGSYSEQWAINYEGSDPQIKMFGRTEPPATSLTMTKDGFLYSNKNGLSSGTWVKKTYSIVYGNTTNHFVVLDPYFRMVNKTLKDARQVRVLGEGQYDLQDACRHHQCQQDCVPEVRGGKLTTACLCGYGQSVMDDNITCQDHGYVLYNTDSTFGRVTLDGEHHMILYNDSSAKIQTFDVHFRSGYLYWSDLYSQTIYRAPAEQPNKKQRVVADVSAFGMAIDWVHDHLYWSDESRIMVAGLDGDREITLLKDLDSPADMAVDPINRLLFWSECGSSLTLRRAWLDGSDIISLVHPVTCGTSLAADPDTSTLYWRVWEGSVHSCDYKGSRVTLLLPNVVHAMDILDHRILWLPVEEALPQSLTNDSFRHLQLEFHLEEQAAFKVVKSSQQPVVPNPCEDTDCAGMCLLGAEPTVPVCLCPDSKKNADICSSSDENPQKTEVPRARNRLELVDSTPFSVTLRFTGSFLTNPLRRPFIGVTEVSSLVPRNSVSKTPRYVRVNNRTLPFTIDNLNPATSYSVVVMNHVTRASLSLAVHTPPPPLTVDRLPLVTVPGIEAPIHWRKQGIHYFNPNPWVDLLDKELILLLVSKEEYSLSYSPDIEQGILDLMEKKIKGKFMILSHYRTEEEFDDDPTMYLGNLPWGTQFWLAMVQVTQYKQSFNLDVVYSETFSLPDVHWAPLMEKIFDEQG